MVRVCSAFLEASASKPPAERFLVFLAPVRQTFLGLVAILSPLPKYLGSSSEDVDFVSPEARRVRGKLVISDHFGRTGKAIQTVMRKPGSRMLVRSEAFRDSVGVDAVLGDSFVAFMALMNDDSADVMTLCTTFESNIDAWKTLRAGAALELQQRLCDVFTSKFERLPSATLESIRLCEAMVFERLAPSRQPLKCIWHMGR